MGAQMVQAIKEVVFTDDDDSLLVVLTDGRIFELFGDGTLETKGAEEFETVVSAI